MYSLYIDTHDKKVVICLFKDGKIIDKFEEISNNKHSVVTMPAIDKIFKDNNIDIKDLNEVLVVNGPGSFTGVRIGVTIAKTIAFCLNIPIRSIDALTVVAINDNRDEKYISIPDKNGAYFGIFSNDNKLLEDIKYYNKSDYNTLENKYEIISDIDIDYEKVYEFLSTKESINPHKVNPLYIKGISALNDK